MNKTSRVLSAMLAILLLLSISACSESDALKSADSLQINKKSHEYAIGYQLELPKKGEEIAVITTNFGEMKLRFFEAAAPKTVYNFKQLAKSGFYDGQIFYRIIDSFMIQTGSGTGTNAGGKSVWGTAFADEFAPNLFNIRGAVSMANSGANTNGSQFFINQARAESFYGWDYYEGAFETYYKGNISAANMRYGSWVDTDRLPKEAKALYTANGGNPSLDGWYSTKGTGHTVFAQVFEGLDVLDAIAGVATDLNDRPLEDVTMISVKIVKYE